MLLLAISGGRDSSALLDIFARENFAEFGIAPVDDQIVILHFNHGTPHAADAEIFVRQLAAKYQLPVEVGRTQKKLKSEAEFRAARLKFFASAVEKFAADFIVTAHHADDAAETILFNLARGSGLAGLSGLTEFSPLPNSSAQIWRPLLGVHRQQLANYLSHRRLGFIEDPSNTDLKFARNRIRHETLPSLAAINSKATENILAASQQIREAGEFLRSKANAWLTRNADKNSIPLPKLNRLPRVLACEVLREIYRRELGHTRRLAGKHFDEILTLASNAGGNKKKKFGELEFTTGKQNGERVLKWKN